MRNHFRETVPNIVVKTFLNVFFKFSIRHVLMFFYSSALFIFSEHLYMKNHHTLNAN